MRISYDDLVDRVKRLQGTVTQLINNGGSGGSSVWGAITGTLSAQSDLQSALNGKAASSHTHTASEVTSGQFADARISESSVTQHQAALSIDASQVANLPSGGAAYLFGDYENDNSGDLLAGDMNPPLSNNFTSASTWTVINTNNSTTFNSGQLVSSRFPRVPAAGTLMVKATIFSAATFASGDIEIYVFKANAADYGGNVANVTFNRVANQVVESIDSNNITREYSINAGAVVEGDRVFACLANTGASTISNGAGGFDFQLYVE